MQILVLLACLAFYGVAVQAVEWPAQGRCDSRDYIGIGSANMTKETCFARARQIKERGRGCNWVSFLSSSVIGSSSVDEEEHSCRCHSTCDSLVVTAEDGEEWETYRVLLPTLDAIWPMWTVLGVLGASLLLWCAISAVCYVRRRRRVGSPLTADEPCWQPTTEDPEVGQQQAPQVMSHEKVAAVAEQPVSCEVAEP
eukprot:TRINITY_DN14769_c0_g1_i1.p1 TRINITY_DN14769_c0_g1~~TRINITY_DN14769_c0_g1_i1.p1  ORF type:complete len:197 (+),score=22.67 TRINITY_DN14769_c0_g1_i1:122-712(+)